MAASAQAASQVFDFAADEAQLLRQRQQAASSSSRTKNAEKDASEVQETPRRPVSRGKKAVAAVTGAIATSLTMTPFDVIKTRLQMQNSPEPLFLPSQRSLTLVGAPAYPLPAPTTTSAPVGLSGALRAAQAHPATCCHATFFTSNADAALACVHDPRIVVGPPGVSSGSSAAVRAAPTHLRPKRPRAAAGKLAPTPPNASTAAACAFPDRGAAARELEHHAGDRRLKGLADGVVKVWRSEGARGLWRGLSPTLLMTVPSQVTYMTCYDVFRSLFLSWERAPPPRDFGGDALSSITAHSLLSSLAAGGLSRCISATLVTPLELVRTRLQATTPGRSTSLSGLLVSLRGEVSASGVTVLWRGLSATLWRDVPFSAIYFMGYEGIKRALTGGGLGEGSVQQGKDEFMLAFVAGATSGSAAAVVTHPFDLLKTRQQVKGAAAQQQRDRLSASLRERRQPGMAQALRDIVQREGGAGLFRGLTPRIAKVAPACGIMIASFEVVGRYLEG